jgi:PAS domain S-box-containing protein
MKDMHREAVGAPSGRQPRAPEGVEEPIWELTERGRDHAIVLLDLKGNVASWHERAQAIMGHEAREIIGTHFSCFYPPEAAARARSELELKIAAVEGRFESEGWRARRDCSRFWAHLVLMALRDHDGELRGFGHVIRNVPQPRCAQALQGAACRTNEFIAMLSHELRNPLAPIRNAVKLLRGEQLTDTQGKWLTGILDRHSAHLVRLVDDLLDVSRLTQGTIRVQREQVDIASVLACALEASRPVIDAQGHTLCLALPEEPVQLFGDSVRLVQVIAELLDNAARYTPRGGEIRVGVKPLGREVQIHVRDTGVGMTPAFMAKAFDLFWRGEGPIERSQGGLGVGLSLARHVVELHDGYLEVRSAGRGKGSEFLIRLPISNTLSAVQTVIEDRCVGGAHAQAPVGAAAAPAQAARDRHFVTPGHYATLNRLLSEFQSDTATVQMAQP